MDDLNVSVIIAQLINFGVLFYIFYYFLGKKIIETIEARRIKLQNLDNSDSVVKEKLDKAQVEVDQMISDWKTKALEIQKNATNLSKKDTLQKIATAEQKADWIIDSAKRNMEKERLSMMDELKSKVLELSLKINSKVFDSNDSNKEFIKKECNSIKI